MKRLIYLANAIYLAGALVVLYRLIRPQLRPISQAELLALDNIQMPKRWVWIRTSPKKFHKAEYCYIRSFINRGGRESRAGRDGVVVKLKGKIYEQNFDLFPEELVYIR